MKSKQSKRGGCGCNKSFFGGKRYSVINSLSSIFKATKKRNSSFKKTRKHKK